MNEFSVKIAGVNQATHSEDELYNLMIDSNDLIHSARTNLRWKVAAEAGIAKRIAETERKSIECANGMYSMRKAIEAVENRYCLTENKLIGKELKISIEGGASAKVANGIPLYSKSAEDDSWSADVVALKSSAAAGATYSFVANKDGIDGNFHAGAECHFSGVEAFAQYGNDKGMISTNAGLLNADAEANADVDFHCKNGRLYGEASAEASAAVSVARASISGQYGDSDMNVHAKADGELLGADAEAKAGIKVNENGTFRAEAKAEAEAYIAKGEVTAGFEFWGIKVDATGEAMVGVQAEAGGSIGNDSASFDVGLGPLGLNVNIDCSGFSFENVIGYII